LLVEKVYRPRPATMSVFSSAAMRALPSVDFARPIASISTSIAS
jgi:hypothetical protein